MILAAVAAAEGMIATEVWLAKNLEQRVQKTAQEPWD
jgi:hypothetical protein